MEFRVLGPLEVSCDRGVVALGGAKPRAILAMLLMHANRPVSAERLAQALWGVDAPNAAVKTVQVHMSRLRKALGGEQVVATTAGGYRLRVDPGQLDVDRFAGLVKSGRDALAAGLPRDAAALLREALGLWRGPPFAGLESEAFAQNEIARLEEERLAALEARVEADLAAGDHAALIAELQQLSAFYPTRERLAGHLILALYRCGRQSEALAAYKITRARLVEEQGIEPGPELRALEAGVLAQDPALDLTPAPARSDPPAEPVHRPPSSPRLVRKRVTVIGVTRRDADPEAMRRMIDAGREPAAKIIERHGGRLLGFDGPELLGVFGLEHAHEDDALRALRAAAELRDGLPGGSGLRVGVDTGEVVAERSGDEVRRPSGEPMWGASGLARRAPAGGILLSDATQQLAPDAIRVEAVDEGTYLLTEVVPNAPPVRRLHLRPMVGRDLELESALNAFERAMAAPRAHLLTVTGEPGIGKSRLAHEFRARVSERATTLVAECGTYGDGSSLWPLRDALGSLASCATPEAIRRLLAGAPDAELVADLALAGLGMSDQPSDPERVSWALRRLFEAAAELQPLVLIFEDIHCADPPLLELLEYLVEWLPATRLFVLCLARPEFREQRKGWFGGWPSMSSITLDRLPDQEAAQLLDSLIHEEPMTVARREVLLAAEGNPLFIEQFHAMRSQAQRRAANRRVPATIELLLDERIDLLDEGEQTVLEHAAVIGREFPTRAVTELLPEQTRPVSEGLLRRLVHRGLVARERSVSPGEDTLRFSHILIRDAAYARCAKEVRSRIHHDFAAILARTDDSLDERIGYHLEQAFICGIEAGNEPTAADLRVAGDAAQRLAAAGLRALDRGDATAAARLLERAVELYEHTGATPPFMLLNLGEALCDSGDFEAGGKALEQACAAAKAANDDKLRAHTLVELSQRGLFADEAPDVDAIRAQADKARIIFEAARDDAGLARTWNQIGLLHWARIRCAEVVDAVERALEHAQRAGDGRARCEAHSLRMRAIVVGPTPVARALVLAQEARTDSTESVTAAAVADIGLAVLESMRMRIDSARELYQPARRTLQEHGLDGLLAGLEIYTAMAELNAGDVSLVEPDLERSRNRLSRAGERGRQPTLAAYLARTRYVQGDLVGALRFSHLSELLSYRHDLASHILWLGIRGRVLADLGQVRKAERIARLSVVIAGRTDANYLQAQALTDLAHVLLRSEKPHAAARALDEATALHVAKENEACARITTGLRESLTPHVGPSVIAVREAR